MPDDRLKEPFDLVTRLQWGESLIFDTTMSWWKFTMVIEARATSTGTYVQVFRSEGAPFEPLWIDHGIMRVDRVIRLGHHVRFHRGDYVPKWPYTGLLRWAEHNGQTVLGPRVRPSHW